MMMMMMMTSAIKCMVWEEKLGNIHSLFTFPPLHPLVSHILESKYFGIIVSWQLMCLWKWDWKHVPYSSVLDCEVFPVTSRWTFLALPVTPFHPGASPLSSDSPAAWPDAGSGQRKSLRYIYWYLRRGQKETLNQHSLWSPLLWPILFARRGLWFYWSHSQTNTAEGNLVG